jgi:tRNA threonylcarbamoyladenosine biosynthesis protein TsaB
MPKCRDILSNLTNANFINNINPSAQSMVNLSYKKFKEKQFEDVAYFEPFYLKDFITVAKNQNK